MFRNYIYIFFGLLFLPFKADALNYSFIQFTTADGLAGNNVYNICQDKDGFIWMATKTGLSRFDGSGFHNFTRKEGLPQNDIPAIFADKKNRIWITPFGRSLCYYLNGKIYTRENCSLLRAIPAINASDSRPVTIMADTAGNLIINVNKVYLYITLSDNRIYRIHPPFGQAPLVPVIGVGSLPSRVRVLKNRLHFSMSTHESFETPLSREWSIIYQYFSGKIYTYNTVRKTISSEISADVPPTTFCQLSDSLFICSNAAGCYVYSFYSGHRTDTLLSGQPVNMSFVDNENGIWLGTNGQGVYYFPPNKSIFALPGDHGHKPVQVYYFNSYKGRVWAGSKNGHIWEVDMKNYTIGKNIPIPSRNKYLLCQERGVVQRNPGWGVLRSNYSNTHKTISSTKSIMSVEDTFVTASYDGRISKFTLPYRQIDSIHLRRRSTCALYESGVYYIGTPDGLYIISQGNKGGAQAEPVLKGIVNTLAYSHKNDLLWVGMGENGIYCMRGNKIIRHFDEAKGLSHNNIKCLFTDGAKVYAGTVDGLNIIDPNMNFCIERYYTLDGLLSNEINCIYASGNTIAVGTSEGISFLNTGTPRPVSACRIAMTEVEVSDSVLELDKKDIRLRAEDNNIRFGFSGISFGSMGRIKYYYRLKGLHNDWKKTPYGYLQYPSLPPGEYMLELYAVNRFNIPSDILRYSFTIQKIWWQHWWVQLMALCLLICCIFSIIGWRLRRTRKKEKDELKLKGKILELEQLALRSQMNPHFIFNSLNSFYQYVIRKDLRGASEFMSHFSRMIRIVFETTTLSTTSLAKELEFLHTYLKLERIKHNNRFGYQFKTEAGLPADHITIPTFVIQPFIENSIRYSIRENRKGCILIKIFTDDDIVRICIDDDGIGREEAEKQKRYVGGNRSRGMALTRERLELYNKIHNTNIGFSVEDKYNDCGAAIGTKVILNFPIEDIYDKNDTGR